MKYYEILDVPPHATPEEIRAAYRVLVQLHHPDRLRQSNESVRKYAEERLKKINEAYTVLGDPAKRAKYDALYLRRRREPESFAYDEPAHAAQTTARRSRRARTRDEAKDWLREEAERRAAEEAAERIRQRAEAQERERRESEERIRREAQELYPRVRSQGNELILYFAPGSWTKLIRIAAGACLMGSDPARDPAARKPELPPHRVDLSDYYIGQYPITNAQFQVYLEAAQRHLLAPLPPDRETYPVVNVTWDDATAFCQWLSKNTGSKFRLPTEAEWEKAARGDDGRIYPWGDEWDAARLNTEQAGTTAIGRYSPAGDSPYGVAEMSGNVWEWCADWYAEKEYGRRNGSVTRDPLGPGAGEGCVVRGGAFDSTPKQVRCAHRNWFYPHQARPNVGFRIVMSAD